MIEGRLGGDATALLCATLLMVASPVRAAPNVAAAEPGESASASASTSTEPSARPLEAAAEPGGATREELARAAFSEARELFREGKFSAAGDAFLRSFMILPSIETLWAAADSFRQAGDVVKAVETYERYFRYVDDDPARVELAHEHHDALAALVGRVNVQPAADVELRAVKVNGELVALESFPILMLEGPVEIEFLGPEPGQQAVMSARVQGRSTTVITFAGFEPQPTPAPAGPSRLDPDIVTPQPRRPSPVVRAMFWTGVGLTAAGAVTAAAFGGLALHNKSAADDIKDSCAEAATMGMMCPEGTPSVEPFKANFERYRRAANISWGVTAGLGVVTLVLGVVTFTQGKREGVTRRARARLGWTAGGVRVAF